MVLACWKSGVRSFWPCSVQISAFASDSGAAAVKLWGLGRSSVSVVEVCTGFL